MHAMHAHFMCAYECAFMRACVYALEVTSAFPCLRFHVMTRVIFELVPTRGWCSPVPTLEFPNFPVKTLLYLVDACALFLDHHGGYPSVHLTPPMARSLAEGGRKCKSRLEKGLIVMHKSSSLWLCTLSVWGLKVAHLR